jgi:hypothetical protein
VSKLSSSVAFIAMVGLLSAACGTGDPEARFGPAGVVSGQSGNDMEAAVGGTLSITPECVLLETSGQEILLVFREGQVSWDAEALELQFEGEKRTVTLADGAEVTFGGGGSSASEDGTSTADYVAQREWVSRPDEGCWRDVRFEVHSAEVPGG